MPRVDTSSTNLFADLPSVIPDELVETLLQSL